MQLITQSTVAGNATLPVSWCFTKEEQELLAQKKAEASMGKGSGPYIVFVTVNGKKEMDRKLVSVEDGQTYIMFRRPGTNTVFAGIVWAESLKVLKKWALSMEKNGKYTRTIYYSGIDKLDSTEIDYHTTRIDVEVAMNLFAKKRSPFQNWLVSWGYQYPMKDQCDFRQRWLVTFIAQKWMLTLLMAMLISLMRGAVTAFYLFFWTRTKTKLSPIIHPFKEGTSDIWMGAQNSGRNIFSKNKAGEKYSNTEGWSAGVLLFTPWLMLAQIAVFTGMIWAVEKRIFWNWRFLYFALVIPIVIAFVGAFVVAGMAITDYVKKNKQIRKVFDVVVKAIPKNMKRWQPKYGLGWSRSIFFALAACPFVFYGYVISQIDWSHLQWKKFFLMLIPGWHGLLIMAEMFAIWAIILLVMSAVIMKWANDPIRLKERENEKKSLEEIRLEEAKTQFAALSCGQIQSGVLPPKKFKQLVYLGFMDLKSKMCKPLPE